VFAGFAREHTGFPVVYPTASSPQAWAAATPLLLLQTVLGLVPDRAERALLSDARSVPDYLEGLSLTGVRAFGRRWAVRVESGAVQVEAVS
jgi:glycogen debranching enzyme